MKGAEGQFMTISEHNCTQTVLNISADTIANQNTLIIIIMTSFLLLSTEPLCPLL